MSNYINSFNWFSGWDFADRFPRSKKCGKKRVGHHEHPVMKEHKPVSCHDDSIFKNKKCEPKHFDFENFGRGKTEASQINKADGGVARQDNDSKDKAFGKGDIKTSQINHSKDAISQQNNDTTDTAFGKGDINTSQINKTEGGVAKQDNDAINTAFGKGDINASQINDNKEGIAKQENDEKSVSFGSGDTNTSQTNKNKDGIAKQDNNADSVNFGKADVNTSQLNDNKGGTADQTNDANTVSFGGGNKKEEPAKCEKKDKTANTVKTDAGTVEFGNADVKTAQANIAGDVVNLKQGNKSIIVNFGDGDVDTSQINSGEGANADQDNDAIVINFGNGNVRTSQINDNENGNADQDNKFLGINFGDGDVLTSQINRNKGDVSKQDNEADVISFGSGKVCTSQINKAEKPNPVAANETSTLWGDPHLIGGDGEKYDIMTPGYQSLLKDKDVAVNGRFTSWNGASTITADDQLGVKYGDSVVELDANKNGQGKLNGKDTTFEANKAYDLGKGCSMTYTGSEYKFTGDDEYDNITAKDNGAYFDTTIHTGAKGVAADGVTPEGYMGETFDADKTLQSGPKHDIEYYKRKSLTDF